MKTNLYTLRRLFCLSEYFQPYHIFLFLLFLVPFFTQANTVDAGKSITVDKPSTVDCGCDISISPSPADGTAYLNGITLGVKPGYKVCLKAGHYVDINLTNFYGTKSQPVTIINCGGLVTVSGYPSYGFVLHASRYVNISGAGDSAYKYGILIDGSVAHTSIGFAEDNQVSDVSLDHMEVYKVGLGIACAPTPNCDPGSWSINWKMYNMNFHDNYVHETFFEGFYIGNTQNYYTYTCGGSTITVQPQQIDSVRFYNNILDKCGWTSAQISQVTGGVDIHDNLITNFGYLNKPEHQAGLIVGGISRGRVYRNKILNGTGSAFQYFGAGLTTVYNNIFAAAGYDGSVQGQNAVLMDDRPKPPGFPPMKIYLINNTIISPKRSGISLYNDFGSLDKGNIIANNIIAAPGLLASYPAFAYVDLQSNPQVSLNNNLELPTTGLAGLVNPAGNDFHLLAGSPAIDSGMNAAAYGIPFDIEGNPRPYGKAYDIGAYEYSGGVTPSLIANAGPNQTITLPVNSVSLDGSQSFDPNGTITSYAWTQLSGPSASTLTTPSTVSTTIKGMIQGTYIFSLTIKDNKGASASAVDTIWVSAAIPQPPVANAGSNQTITLPVNSANLDGSLSYSQGGSISSYSWTEQSGPSTAAIGNNSAATTSVSGLIQGTYVFNLTVKDKNALTATASVTVWVITAAPLPPVANAGSNQTITLPANSATLDGSLSYAPSGTISSYSWIQQSGPSAAALGNNSAITTPVTGLLQGTYIFNLTVKDNNGSTAMASVTVWVNQVALQPPVANAGNNQTITLPVNSVTLDGSQSHSPNGSISSYGWTEQSGPSIAAIATISGAATNVTNLIQGTYVFSLTIQDDKGASASTTVTVLVNVAIQYQILANAGKDTSIAIPANSAVLNGMGSTGNIATYQWLELSGPSMAAIGSPGAAYSPVGNLVAGDYVFQLTVTDPNGGKSKAFVKVSVISTLRYTGSIILYPNPAHDVVNLRLITDSAGMVRINIYDMEGKIVLSEEKEKSKSNLEAAFYIARLAKGAYVLQAIIGRSKGMTAKFIKQ